MGPLRSRLDDFERELSRGGDPRVEDYVVGGGAGYWEELFEFLEVDIDLRIRRGERVSVRDYLVRFPGLEEHRARVLRLLDLEVSWRRELGLPLAWSEYRERYPQWRPMLEEKFWSMDLMVPEVPGYDLRPVIAKGGMGVVFSAWDQKLGREVAIKVMRPGMPEAAFSREAEITARLQHPGIPPVHDRGKLSEGLPYLVMKLIRGETLEVILDRQKRDNRLVVGRSELLGVFERICQAVGYAHRQGVIHRDLKPSNVMVGAFGEVQVMDWGLSRELVAGEEMVGEEIQSGGLLRTILGSVKGTPAYMAPEQARAEKLDARADVFALGGILLSILTGHPPFEGSDREETLARAKKNDLGNTKERLGQSEADPDLQALCVKCLASRPQERPADGMELAAAVEAYRAEVEDRLKRAEMARVREEEQRKRRRAQWALSGAVLLLAAAGSFGAVVSSLWQSAEINRNEAVYQRNAANESLQLVETERQKLLLFKVCSTLRSAQAEWSNGFIEKARKLLGSIEPKLRKWEWHYLNRLCNPSIMIINHESTVKSYMFCPNGTIITIGFNNLKTWDAKTGKELLSFTAPTDGGCPIVAVSPDGGLAITDLLPSPPAPGSNWISDAKIWNTKKCKCVLELKGHSRPVNAAAFSMNGSKIVTADQGGTLMIWDSQSKTPPTVLRKGDNWYSSLVFNADGNRILAVLDRVDANSNRVSDGAHVLDAKTGQSILHLKGHVGKVNFANYSPDGSKIVTGGDDRTAKIWDASTGKLLRTFLHDHDNKCVYSGSISRDGSLVVTASAPEVSNKGRYNFDVRLWDTTSGNYITKWKMTSLLSGVAISLDGRRILTGGDNEGDVQVLDARTDPEKLVFKLYSSPVQTSCFNRGFDQILSGNLDGMMKVTNAATGKVVYHFAMEDRREIKELSYSPDGKRIIGITYDGQIRGWNPSLEVESLYELKGAGKVTRYAWSPEGKRIATSSSKGDIQVWDIKKDQLFPVFSIGAESEDSHDIVLEPLPGGAFKTTPGAPFEKEVDFLQFSPDGKKLITIRGGEAKVLDAATGTELISLVGERRLKTASYNQDCTRIVTSNQHGLVQIWDASSGLSLVSFKAHDVVGFNPDIYASFTLDGSRIITTCNSDDSVKIWDPVVGEEVLALKCEKSSSAVSFDGKRILIGNPDGSVTTWDSRLVSESVAERDTAELEAKREIK